MPNQKLGEDKSPEIRKAMDELSREAGGPGLEAGKHGACMLCGKNPVGEFTDELSKREYLISGCCQACQDKMFADE
jgi:hypothetical protein